ncbi:MAG: glycerol-3-phosphate acyltransferase [Lactobacillus sp.]|nr:glycerol-3-phosphate acyltransferase [Lactobacillus sp.]
MREILSIVIGYLLGSVMTAYLIGLLIFKKNPAEYGSGNPGSANVGAVFGKKFGILTCIGDFIKTAIALLVTWLFFRNHVLLAYTGFGLVLGHCFPLYFGFKGGKGVATCGLFLLIYDWQVAVPVLLVALALMCVLQDLTIPPIFFMIIFTVIEYTKNLEAGCMLGLMTLIMIYKFRNDILNWIIGQNKRVDVLKTIKSKLIRK